MNIPCLVSPFHFPHKFVFFPTLYYDAPFVIAVNA